MILIPAIDLKDGQCVRLRQGRMDDDTVFSDNPVERAGRWYDAGARRLHLVDLNGAFEGKPVNGEIIQETVILSPGNSAPQPPAEWKDPGIGQDDLPETIAITPGARPTDSEKSDAQTAVQNKSNQKSSQTDSEKLRSKVDVGKKEDLSQDDDILTETIILRPEKNKGPKNE